MGYRETPGRPAIFATTKKFLDDLNLRSLEELPPLDELQAALEQAHPPVVALEASSLRAPEQTGDSDDSPDSTEQTHAG